MKNRFEKEFGCNWEITDETGFIIMEQIIEYVIPYCNSNIFFEQFNEKSDIINLNLHESFANIVITHVKKNF